MCIDAIFQNVNSNGMRIVHGAPEPENKGKLKATLAMYSSDSGNKSIRELMKMKSIFIYMHTVLTSKAPLMVDCCVLIICQDRG